MNRALRLTVASLLAGALLAAAWSRDLEASEEVDGADGARVVFLVRHAEKGGERRDPGLSASGKRRVTALEAALRDAGVAQVHSTDYARTRQTAAAFSKAPRLYDPRKLDALVAHVKKAPGRHLVVGHSNTTTDVVRRLGGDPGPPIDDKTEFDRLYVVTIGPDGTVTTIRLRYGATGETR